MHNDIQEFTAAQEKRVKTVRWARPSSGDICPTARMVGLAPQWVRLAPNGTNLDLKKPRICPIWGQSDPLWSQTYYPCWQVSLHFNVNLCILSSSTQMFEMLPRLTLARWTIHMNNRDWLSGKLSLLLCLATSIILSNVSC